MMPFQEDALVCELAEGLGLTLQRRDAIEITDEKALKLAGLMREVPDYAAIRKALHAGAEVPGAVRKGIEYVLRRGEE